MITRICALATMSGALVAIVFWFTCAAEQSLGEPRNLFVLGSIVLVESACCIAGIAVKNGGML